MASGQTAFEYLLLLAGGILVAVVVFGITNSIHMDTSDSTNTSLNTYSARVHTYLSTVLPADCSACSSQFEPKINQDCTTSGAIYKINSDGSAFCTTMPTGSGGSVWTTSGNNIYYNTGNVGIGVTAPKTKLDVNGAVKLGTQTTCNADSEGAMRYNSASKAVEFCDGTSWKTISSGASGTWTANGNNQYSGVSGNVGIGTSNPEKKLDVVGSIKASEDVCNNAGNCLSALAGLVNACGPAAKTYPSTATAYSSPFCSMGYPTPSTPAFPVTGAQITWTCLPLSSSDFQISCTATHDASDFGTVCATNENCLSGRCYRDFDGDGYAATSGEKTCKAVASLGSDCDDNSANAYPGNLWKGSADSKDNDCNGVIDDCVGYDCNVYGMNYQPIVDSSYCPPATTPNCVIPICYLNNGYCIGTEGVCHQVSGTSGSICCYGGPTAVHCSVWK